MMGDDSKDSDGGAVDARETLRIIRDDPRGAVERLERRIAAGQGDFRTWHNLAVSLAKSGEVERALAAAETALKENPQSAPSHFLHGMLLKGRGCFADALGSFEAVARIDARYPRLYGTAVSFTSSSATPKRRPGTEP